MTAGNREAVRTVFYGVTDRRRFEFPDGSLLDIVVPASGSGGSQSEVEITLPPVASTPPPHVHPHQQETCTVLDGSLDVMVDRRWRPLSSGESVTIPAGQVHTYRNRSGQNVSFRCAHTPALGFQQFMERLYWLSAMNRIRDRRDLTSALYSSLLLNTHRADVVPAAPVTRLRVRALAGVAKLLRMRVDR